MVKEYKTILNLLVLLISVHAFFACTEIDDNKNQVITTNKEILVLFEPNALGDFGYNDQIYRGLVESMNSDSLAGVKVSYYNPISMAEAKKMISVWKDDTVHTKNKLLVLASSTYRQAMDSIFSKTQLDTASRRILLFESKKVDMKGVHTFQMSLYGTSYISGAVVGKLAFKPLVAIANSTDTITEHAVKGFSDGFVDYGGKAADIAKVYLTKSNAGYNMADSVYNLMHDWTKANNFIFPIMGGSAKGVYRFIREKPTGLYTVGVDVDQSDLCSHILGSMVKKMNTVLRSFLLNWVAGKPLPTSITYDLKSGYTDWVQGHVTLSDYGVNLEEIKAKAIQKESEYEKH